MNEYIFWDNAFQNGPAISIKRKEKFKGSSDIYDINVFQYPRLLQTCNIRSDAGKKTL